VYEIQLVFQGGGAKLVALVAAAEAAYDACPKLGLKVSRVSGTSAGAIAGCMLATGKDPRLFKQSLLRLAEKYLPKITTEPWIRTKAIYDGTPLYKSEIYKDFLGDLFYDTAQMTHMRELKVKCLFHAADIENGTFKSFDGSQNDHTIKNALYYSSALPFIFETYRGSPYVDGGLINNFPSDGLREGIYADHDIIGLAFKKHGTYKFKNAFEYSKALIFTAMDVAVGRSMGNIPDGNVLFIDTDVDTLDFAKAMLQLQNMNYDGYKDKVIRFLEDYAERRNVDKARQTTEEEEKNARIRKLEGEEKKKNNSIRQTINYINDYHYNVMQSSKYKTLKKTVIGTCNGLLNQNPNVEDELQIRELIEPMEATGVSAYGAVIGRDSKMFDVGSVRPRVTKFKNGQPQAVPKPYEVIPLRFPFEGEMEHPLRHNLMFFFYPALIPEEGVAYEISFALSCQFLLTDALDIEKNEDVFCFFCDNSTELLQMVFYLPGDMNLFLDSMPERWIEKIEKVRADVLGSRYSSKTWVESKVMSEHELNGFGYPAKLVPKGWTAANLISGQATGVLVHR